MANNTKQYRLSNLIRCLFYCFAITGNCVWASTVHINTASFLGQSGQLAIDFIDGGSPSNSFSLTHFDFGTGATIGSTALTGGVSGNLASRVDFADTDFLNELLVDLKFGDLISFEMINATNLTENAGSLPDSLTIFLLDSLGQPLLNTADPTATNTLMRLDFGVEPAVSIYSPEITYTPSVVPTPSSIYFLVSGLPLLVQMPNRKLSKGIADKAGTA